MALALERAPTLSGLAPETRCLYDIYKKEGDDLYCKRRYKKALTSYNEALRLVQRNTQTLVARSRCYMGIGLMQKALDDAEAALSINASYLPALYQKAQIHYRQGNYEMALLTFNRGHKLNSSAPGFLEGMQKAQHAMDIMTTGRHMKTSSVGDLSLYLPKKMFRRHTKLEQNFQLGRKSFPTLPSLKNREGKDQRLPSPGFRKRHGTLLLQVQKRRPAHLEQPRFGRGDLENRKVNDKAMRDILGQLYDDKEYFERVLGSADGQRDLSEMLSSVLEDGLKFLYDRVLFWAQSGSLPPAPPHPTNVQAIQWPITRVEEESSDDGGTEEDEGESDDDMTKVTDAIDAVSSVNGPTSNRRKKKLKVRRRRADILKKRASVIVVPKKKVKKTHFKKPEVVEPDEDQIDASKISFRFKSLPALGDIALTDRSQDGRSELGTTTVDESEMEGSVVGVDEAMLERRRQREERRRIRREERIKRREEEHRKKKEEAEKDKVGKETKGEEQSAAADPLTEYLNKMMDTLEELFQKNDYNNLKTKAESFLLTMEKYDKNITEHIMSYVGKAHSYLGNAYIGLKNYDFAMMHHDKDLEIGERWKLSECVSRALGNLGRVYISRQKYDQALKYLAQKTRMPCSPRETTWLYHEIASCFLQLHHYQFAKDAATKSLEAAADVNDSLYQLQTSVLLGAIQVKLQKFEKAYGSFERAMDQARLRDDKKAQQAISEALQEVNERIVREARRKQAQQQKAPPADASVVTQAEDDAKNSPKANSNENGEEAGSNNSISESARDTGEDPELTGLVTDDDTESQATQEGKDKKDEAGDEEGEGKKEGEKEEKEKEEGQETVDEKKAKAEEAQETSQDGEKVEKEEKIGEVEESKKKDGDVDQGVEKKEAKEPAEDGKGANKNDHEVKDDANEAALAVDKEKDKDENKANAGDKDVKDDKPDGQKTQDENQTESEIEQSEPQTAAAASEEKSGKAVDSHKRAGDGETENNKDNEEAGSQRPDATDGKATEKTAKENDKEKEKDTKEEIGKEDNIAVGVTVVVDNENAKSEKEDKTEEPATDKGNISGASPDVTYKLAPITQETLTKNMAKDRGMKENVRKSVLSIHESVRESESRRNSARPKGQIEATTKKTVTIGGEEQIIDGKKEENIEAKKEVEEEPTEPPEPRGKDQIADKMDDDLAQMEEDYTAKNFDQVLKKGSELMKSLKRVRNIDKWSKRRLRNFAKLHSFMGSASSEKQNFDKARLHHNADLKIGEVMGNTKIQSRAYEHLGRTYIFENKYEKALEFFAKRAHLPRNSEETARLFHEIANCFFQLKAYEFAKDAAMVSMKAANEGNHTMFQLQSAVLIGVTKVKLQRSDEAFETFEEALKFASIRDDEQAAEAIRQAMKQIETKVALNVKDKWLKKVRDSKERRQKEAEEVERLSKISESDRQSHAGAESASTVCGLLSSMQENDGESETTNATDCPAPILEEKEEKRAEAGDGESGNLDTNRTDKTGFLLAPDGPMDKKQKQKEKTIKVAKETNENNGQQGQKQAKKTTTTAKKSNTGSAAVTEKDKGKVSTAPNDKKNVGDKNSSPRTANTKPKTKVAPTTKKNEEAQVKTNIGAAKQHQSDANEATNLETGRDPDTAEVATDVAKAEAPSGENSEAAKTNESHEESSNESKDSGNNGQTTGEEANKNSVDPTSHGQKGEGDVLKDNENKREVREGNEKENEDIIQEKKISSDNDNATKDNIKKKVSYDSNDTSVAEKTTTGESSQPAAKNNVKEETSEKAKAASNTVASMPKQTPRKPKPKPTETENERKAPPERRKSERFIGLDPRKVAEAKNKSPKPIPEEEQEKVKVSPKPKTERFIGLKPAKEKKSLDGSQTSRSDGSTGKDRYSVNEEEKKEMEGLKQMIGEEKQPVKSDKESENVDSNDAPKPLAVPTILQPENSPSPQKAVTAGDDNQKITEDDYGSNVPKVPMLTINDEVGFVRHDSISSKVSGPRPATRMSLADIVKDDQNGQQKDGDKNTSRAELSALNAMVKEAIKHDKKELKKAQEEHISPKESPRKASKARPSNASQMAQHSLEEMRREAEMKRARRKRFLRNWKASFLLMLNSPYAEVNSIQGRRLSTDFKQYKRSMSKANLSLTINEEGTYYQSVEDFNNRQQRAVVMKMSPRKSHWDKTMIMAAAAGSAAADKNGARANRTGKKSTTDDDEILDHIEEHLAMQNEVKAKKESRRKTTEEARISAELALAAKEMRRKERDGRREERKRLEEAERQRRVDERDERDLLAAMATKVSFSNPYDKTPNQIPKMTQRSSLGGDDEKKWMLHQERKLLRAKRRERREKELKKRHEEEKMRRKLGAAAVKSKTFKIGSKENSPRESLEEEKDYQEYMSPELGETPEDTPELLTPVETSPETTGSKDGEEEEKEGEDNRAVEEAKAVETQVAATDQTLGHGDQEEPKAEEGPTKKVVFQDPRPEEKGKDKKKVKKKEDKKAKKEQDTEKDETQKPEIKEEKEEPKEEDKEQTEKEEEAEEEGVQVDDFDGYNDSDEDDDDLVAIYIEKEVRKMRADFNEDKFKEVLDRGNALLKALRKHTDIVSWSRRRLRWFAAAHTYMGSANVEVKEFHKAQSHHQADYRIGEALEDTKIQSRALEHLARVSVFNKNTPKALEYLAKRAHLPRDLEQSARLFHEMANCFFTLGAVEYARDAAAESIEAASKGGHGSYLLQSTLLLAVCHSRLKDYNNAQEHFSSALAHARRLNDKNTEEAIHAALKEVERKRAAMVRDKWKGKLKKDNPPIDESGEFKTE